MLLIVALGCGDATEPPVPASLTVIPVTDFIELGGELRLVATVRDQGGAPMSSVPLEWLSLDPSIALVDPAGTVTGVGIGGPVEIRAMAAGLIGSSLVTVVPPLWIHVPFMAWGEIGLPYSASLISAGGVPSVAHSFSVTSGTMPPGLVLAATGEISGTPAQSGTWSVEASVTDGRFTSSAAVTLDVVEAFELRLAATVSNPSQWDPDVSRFVCSVSMHGEVVGGTDSSIAGVYQGISWIREDGAVTHTQLVPLSTLGEWFGSTTVNTGDVISFTFQLFRPAPDFMAGLEFVYVVRLGDGQPDLPRLAEVAEFNCAP